MLEMTRAQDQLGIAPRLEVLQAEQIVARAEATLPAKEVGLAQSANRPATLTAGRSADVTASLRKGGGQPRARYSASVGVPADVIRVRPDMRMAERNLAVAMAGMDEAEAVSIPD